MNTAIAHLESISPYSQSKFFQLPKNGKETHDDYEKRTWKQRVHVDERGVPFMPPMSLKKCLDGASTYLGKIPGERNATYVKRFKSGILVTEPIPLRKNDRPVTIDDFEGEWLFLDANGKPGGTRVLRCMPRLVPWTATATIYVIDEVITKDVLAKALSDAGMLVGVGRFNAYPVNAQGACRCVNKSASSTTFMTPVVLSTASRLDANTSRGCSKCANAAGRRSDGEERRCRSSLLTRAMPRVSTRPSRSMTHGRSARFAVGRFDDGCQPDRHGRFRPAVGGFYGRCKLTKLEFS